MAKQPPPHQDSDFEDAVSDALRNILGKRIRRNDVKGVTDALNRVIAFEVVDGRRVPKWKAPTGVVENDLGAEVTGAEASLYRFAQRVAKDLEERLEALRPIAKVVDEDRLDSTREIFRTELHELIRVLGSEINLRPLRIDEMFIRLEMYMNQIASVFGFGNPKNIHTVDDERADTDYKLIRRYLSSLRSEWKRYKKPSSKQTLGRGTAGDGIVPSEWDDNHRRIV
jgi:hypothetical protein